MGMNSPQGPGWYTDPTGRFSLRYFSGQEWTAHVTDQSGNRAVDHGQVATGSAPEGAPTVAAGTRQPANALQAQPVPFAAATGQKKSRTPLFIGLGAAVAVVVAIGVVAVTRSSSSDTVTAPTVTAAQRSPSSGSSSSGSSSGSSNGSSSSSSGGSSGSTWTPTDVELLWSSFTYSEQVEICLGWSYVSDDVFISDMISIGMNYSDAVELVEILWRDC